MSANNVDNKMAHELRKQASLNGSAAALKDVVVDFIGLISDNLHDTKLTLEQSSFLHNCTVTRPFLAILHTTP